LHLGGIDVFGGDIVERAAIVGENFREVALAIFHLLLKIARTEQFALVIHADCAGNLDVIADADGV
jgi:hypothetical protein